MEVRQIVKRLLERKIALALVLIAATGLAYMVGSRSETTTTGAATTQILIDAPQSALANLKQNTLPLTTRAGMFAQFMASTAVRESIGRAAGVPASQIVAKGPFDDPDAAPTGVTAATDAGAAPPAYVLTFVAQEELPIVTVYAAAPDAKSASKLAGAVAEGVQQYVDDLQTENELPENDRVTIRGLGTPEGGTVISGGAAPAMVGVFIVVTVLGCGAILVFRRRRPDDEALMVYEDPFADGPLPVDGNGNGQLEDSARSGWHPPAAVK